MKHYYGENQGDMGYGEGRDMGCQGENRLNMRYQAG